MTRSSYLPVGVTCSSLLFALACKSSDDGKHKTTGPTTPAAPAAAIDGGTAADPAPVNGVDASTAAAPAAPLTGRYSTTHTVYIVCNEDPDGCPEEVQDTLDIKEDTGNSIQVVIELVQANAHSCSFEGRLTKSDEGKWGFSHPADSEDGECSLELRIDQGSFIVDSEGCRHYCGARAQLFASFNLDSRKPL